VSISVNMARNNSVNSDMESSVYERAVVIKQS